MDCVKVVENLSQREKNSILHVLQRDEELRYGQEQKISNLKREVNQIRMCSVLRAGDDQSKICLRCRTEMGIFFNRGSLCPACKYKVCKDCQEIMFNGSWLCKLCYKQRQLKWLSGEWTASFDQNPLRKWASGSDLMKASLQLMPGTTSIDIDESPSNQGNNRQGRKVSRNGVGGSDQGKTRVEAPKDGDQLKLSELFNVLRVKKPEEKISQETQVRRITSRKYSESDSDSSSTSDVDVRSTSTAPSVTESELDGHRIESPRHLESPPLKTLRLNETPERYKPVKKVESLDYRVDNGTQRPIPSTRSPKPAARRKVKSEHLDQENVPSARPRTKDRRSPRSERIVEGQMSMSRSVEVQSAATRQADDDETSIHSELSLHVAKTRESLDKKFEVEKSRSQASLDKRSLESESPVRPKSKEQLARKSADNLSLEPKQTLNSEQNSLHKGFKELDNKIGADLETSRSYNKPDIKIKSSDSRGSKLVDESLKSVSHKDNDDRSIQSKHSSEKEQLLVKEEDGQTQRTGSPYSFSMDSLPSSHPSPTFIHSSFSSNPDSDTDSVARANSRPESISEKSPVSEKRVRSVPKVTDGEEVVVEEISKVQFRRISKTVAQMGSLAKMSLSPNKNKSADVVIDQKETQSRGGAGLREEGGDPGNNKMFEEEEVTEEDICIKQVKSENMSPSSDVTELLIRKLERMDRGTNRSEMSKFRNRTAEEMTWINEYDLSNREVDNCQVRSVKRLPRIMTSSVASDYDRKASEADSIEDMIDNMARAHLFVDTDLPARASVTDSDAGCNLTPISPFPQEIYEKRSGEYNRFAYISDDNLDGDSADDLLDDEANNEMDRSGTLVKSQDVGLQQGKKKELKSMDSLDLILNDQEDYVDGHQQVIELEKEYQNALKFSEDETAARELKEGMCLPKDDDLNHIASQGNDEKKPIETVNFSSEQIIVSKDAYDDESTSEKVSDQQNLVKDEIKPVTSKQLRSKPKLKAADSLDVLLDQQGNLVDKDAQNVEFDTELLENLEQNLRETLSVQKSNPTLSQEYAYLGIQHDMMAEKIQNKHSDSEPNQDDFEAIVGDAKDYLDGKTEKAATDAKPKLRCIEFFQHEYSSENSDSDTLSVIEEVEDERSESSDDDNKIDDNKRKTEIDIDLSLSKSKVQLEKVGTEKEVELSIEKKVVVTENESKILSTRKDQKQDTDQTRVKGKIFQKVKDIEQKSKYQNKGGSTVGAAPKSDTKRQERYKKIHDHWLAVEKHEADILDIDESDKDTQESMPKFERKEKDQTYPTQDVDCILQAVETKPVVIPASEINEEVNNEFYVNGKSELSTEGKNELEKVDFDSINNSLFETDVKTDVNSVKTDHIVGAEMQQNVIKECDNSNNSSNINDESTEEKQESNVILNSTMIDSKTHISASINDSNALCHSISDISGFNSSDLPESSPIIEQLETSDISPSLQKSSPIGVQPTTSGISGFNSTDLQESSPIGEQPVTSYIGNGTSFTAKMDYCHTLPDIEKEQMLQECSRQGNVSASKTSITDPEGSCQSISELPDPITETLSSESSAVCFSLHSNEGTENSNYIKDDVFDTKITVIAPDCKVHAGTSKERLNSDEIRIQIKSMQQSKKVYKTEVALEVDRSGKVTPPATMSSDPQFFKAPEKPPRIKKQNSSSSEPSSPEIAAINPKAYMDSSKSEKLSSTRDSPRTVSECSVSQDDSGNVSGGSRGTTPEHRRTDSSYSQSSLPSTLSNVTDEDEDIDCIVAKVQRQSNASRGSNLLSVFGDSRESLASYYSDAGDITYSNVPITGEVLFGLNYNYKTNMLEVGVKQCRNIALADTKRRRSDPYVKTYLLPDRTRGGKRKTKVKKHTTSPTFDETLKYSLTKSELENRTLWLTVWHNDRFGRNVFLGEVTINFDYYKFVDPIPKWYPLQERMDAPPPNMMVYKGDLSICIRYVPAEKLGASPAHTGKQKKESGKGQLQVMVKEARNLTGVKSNGFSDPFCKAYLLPERHKSSKQKTSVVKKDCSPVWNHTFICEDVTLMELRERCLELTIWDYEKLTSNDFLGGIRLNLGTGVSGGKAVDWMDARGEEMSMWQAMLDRPNIWIDGALILRPNMEKRKF